MIKPSFFALALCALQFQAFAAPLPDQKDSQRALYGRDQDWLWQSVQKAKQEADKGKTAFTFPPEPMARA